MKNQSIVLGTLIYLILIISGAFSDVVMYSLLALPIFFLSVIFFFIFMFHLPVKEESKNLLANAFLTVGVLLLAMTVFDTALSTTRYLVDMSREGIFHREIILCPWILIFRSLGLALTSSLFIVLGLKRRTLCSIKTIRLIGMVIFLSSPSTMILVKILEKMNFPLSS